MDILVFNLSILLRRAYAQVPPRQLFRTLGLDIWRVLGTSWGGLGRLWGGRHAILDVLGAFWGVLRGLEGCWARIGWSCGMAARFLNEKVANMTPTWFPKRSQNMKKLIQKSIRKLIPLEIGFKTGVWWIFCAKMEPSWH